MQSNQNQNQDQNQSPSLRAELLMLQARQARLEETIRERLAEAHANHVRAAVSTLSSTLRAIKARIESVIAELSQRPAGATR